ncbi:hypothetical protein [Nocardia macrotermitis]|uniref:DUF8020 domain-containing protein n=1 Tax=Nocardia macrotermitis TaxID=2585198 RepID=A0A7K0D118_9NOCA|nr:hypothetical protein [Nocardia macrotermitis]MQY19425.1 hypothetical protein [Nocardia macrotermitis]
MKFGKITAVVFMAIAATGIAAATANGQPTVAAPQQQPAPAVVNNATSGVDHGVAYHTTVSKQDRATTTTVRNGRFEVAGNGHVVLHAADGTTLADVPQTYQLGGRALPIARTIAADGKTLTLTPKPSAEDVAVLKNIAYEHLRDEIIKNGVGIILGVIVGGFVGALLGFGFLSLITAPIGWVIGGIAGGYLQGGQEFLDAVQGAARGH